MMAIYVRRRVADRCHAVFSSSTNPLPPPWLYPQFVDYQKELSNRIRDGKGRTYAVRLIDAFEETWGGRTYFAAYEFVADGRDLDTVLEEEREVHRRTRVAPTSDPAVWARHVTWAKVLMGAVAALHESRIIHADLKPANAFLIKDASLGSGYQLKLIDTDFSVLADRKAPWHGYQGYVGTDNYRSIEHMTRGAVPILASDIFTCGLILMTARRCAPVTGPTTREYAKGGARAMTSSPVSLGVMPPPATTQTSRDAHLCLSPDPKRADGGGFRAALSGRAPKSATAATSATLKRSRGQAP